MLRHAPFDASTVEGRSKERYRRMVLTGLAQAGSRGLLAVTLLIAVPLTVGYLGQERYGLWATISSFLALLQFADLGVGNGLLNAIAQAHGRDDQKAAARYVSSAFFLLLSLSLALALGFAVIYPLIPWQKLFKVTSPAAVAEAGPAMAILVVILLINLPVGIVRRVQLGYQEGFASHVWDGVGNLLGLVALSLAAFWRASVPWLVLALDGSLLATTLINFWVLFRLQRPWLRPVWNRANRSAALTILRIGFLFFVLQLAGIIAFSSDNLVVAQVLGAEAVTHYSVPARLFSLVTVILNVALLPLWPAYGEAIARGDLVWVNRTLIRSLVATLLAAAAGSIGLVVVGSSLIRIWTDQLVAPSLALQLGFSVWVVAASVGSALSMLLNGANAIRFQALVATLMALVALTTKVTLAKWIGLPGVIWGTVIAYLLCSLLLTGLYIPRLLGRIGQSIR